MSVVTRSSLKRKEREISIKGGIDAHASKRRTGVAKEGKPVRASGRIPLKDISNVNHRRTRSSAAKQQGLENTFDRCLTLFQRQCSQIIPKEKLIITKTENAVKLAKANHGNVSPSQHEVDFTSKINVKTRSTSTATSQRLPTLQQLPPYCCTSSEILQLPVIDIDIPRKDCYYSPYNVKMYEIFRQDERTFAQDADYIESKGYITGGFTPVTRTYLVDAMMSICIKCSMRRETLCLAVNLVDRYLASTAYDECFDEEILLQNGDKTYWTSSGLKNTTSNTTSTPVKMLLIGLACIMLASKYEEGHRVTYDEVLRFLPRTFPLRENAREITIKLEGLVGHSLGWKLTVPTVTIFLSRYISASFSSHKTIQKYYELWGCTLLNYKILKFLPSLVAASIIWMVRKINCVDRKINDIDRKIKQINDMKTNNIDMKTNNIDTVNNIDNIDKNDSNFNVNLNLDSDTMNDIGSNLVSQIENSIDSQENNINNQKNNTSSHIIDGDKNTEIVYESGDDDIVEVAVSRNKKRILSVPLWIKKNKNGDDIKNSKNENNDENSDSKKNSDDSNCTEIDSINDKIDRNNSNDDSDSDSSIWTSTLQFYTGYTEADLSECLKCLISLETSLTSVIENCTQ